MEVFNIVNIIEKNTIGKLNNINNNKLITKIKENFSNDEQKLY